MTRFLAIEGLDGAGTTTQAARLIQTLGSRGRVVVATREPTTGPIGRIIRTTLRAEVNAPAEATLPWLFAADRADHLHRTVLPALQEGACVVTDRYFHSSLAYQSLSIPLDEVWGLNQGFRVPDLTVFLRVPVDECLRRIGDRQIREIFEEKSRLDAIAASYERVVDFLRAKGHRIVDVDGTAPQERVAEAILALVEA